MDFSFTSEQDDLRREARAFLEANPSPSMEQLAELGWVGILQGDDFTFLDAAVLFEELGRALYDGPYVLNEVSGQPGDDVWSIEIDGFVPHLAQVSRVLTPAMEAERAEGETLATVDETLGLGRLATQRRIAGWRVDGRRRELGRRLDDERLRDQHAAQRSPRRVAAGLARRPLLAAAGVVAAARAGVAGAGATQAVIRAAGGRARGEVPAVELGAQAAVMTSD